MHKIRLTRKRVEIKKHSYVVTHKTHTFNSAAYTFLWCSLKETSCSCHCMSLQSKVVVFFFYSNLHWFVDLLFLLRLWQLTPPPHTHTPHGCLMVWVILRSSLSHFFQALCNLFSIVFSTCSPVCHLFLLSFYFYFIPAQLVWSTHNFVVHVKWQ